MILLQLTKIKSKLISSGLIKDSLRFGFWIHTDSLEPKYEKGAVVLIKQTYYDQAGAIYAIDFDGQTLIKRVFHEANGIRLVSLNKKYSDQIIPLDEEPGVIGKVIDGFVPLDLEEIK